MRSVYLNRLFRILLPPFILLIPFITREPLAQEVKPYLLPKVQLGKASFYCPSFHGNRTAWGTYYDEKELVAAHPYYPFGTVVRITNLANDRTVEVSVIDRGPSRKHQRRGGVIDVSRGAAYELGMIRQGRVRVRVEVLQWGHQKAKFDALKQN
jgi:rare lipoprotein A